MGLEQRLSRSMFAETEMVQLRQVCMTSSGLFEPGKYFVGQLPDVAFEMGLVEKLPPVRGKSEEIGDSPEELSPNADTNTESDAAHSNDA